MAEPNRAKAAPDEAPNEAEWSRPGGGQSSFGCIFKNRTIFDRATLNRGKEALRARVENDPRLDHEVSAFQTAVSPQARACLARSAAASRGRTTLLSPERKTDEVGDSSCGIPTDKERDWVVKTIHLGFHGEPRNVAKNVSSWYRRKSRKKTKTRYSLVE
ncbi:MAG: hypothetical protein M0Z80_14150 [Treponema sp.]|nr:hypothetical protein [Treponema sp.]